MIIIVFLYFCFLVVGGVFLWIYYLALGAYILFGIADVFIFMFFLVICSLEIQCSYKTSRFIISVHIGFSVVMSPSPRCYFFPY